MMTSLNKKYFILSFIICGISNIVAMDQTKQRKIDATFEKELEDIRCGRITRDYSQASPHIQKQIIEHNESVKTIWEKADAYNENCRRQQISGKTY